MNLLDWLLVVLVLAYALSGYWQGFITGAFATGGLLLGGLFGVWLAPIALGDANPSLMVSLGALFIVILAASLGQASSSSPAPGSARRSPGSRSARSTPSAVPLLSAFAVLLVAWALGVAISGSRIGGVTPLVRSSTVLAQVDEVLPNDGRQRAAGLQRRRRHQLLPALPRAVRAGAHRRGRARPQAAAHRPRRRAGRGQRRSRSAAPTSCGRGVEGSGFLYAPNRLMTNAHVVAGVDDPEVLIGDDSVPAEVVYYNPDLDIAVLALDSGDTPTLAFDRTAEATDGVAILGYPQDGPYHVEPGRIRSEQRLRSPNIYGDGAVIREVYSLRGRILPGNSGGPIVSSAGDVVGVVFAASVTDHETGYALTADPGLAERRHRHGQLERGLHRGLRGLSRSGPASGSGP